MSAARRLAGIALVAASVACVLGLLSLCWLIAFGVTQVPNPDVAFGAGILTFGLAGFAGLAGAFTLGWEG